MKKIIYILAILTPVLANAQRYAPVTALAKDSTKVLTTQGGASKWTYASDLTGTSKYVADSARIADSLTAHRTAINTNTSALAQTYQSVTVATYAAAITAATGSQRKSITVTADEKDGNRTNTYLWDGTTLTQRGLPIKHTLSTGTNADQPNTVAGYQAGDNIVQANYTSGTYGAIVSGSANTIFGFQAGQTLDRGSENTIMGYRAGTSLVNTAGDPLVTAATNTFIGTYAGGNTTTGSANVAIGQKAGVNNTTGGANVWIGKSTGATLTTSTDGVWIGTGAGEFANTSGTYNTVVGRSAGSSMKTTAGSNTIIGGSAGSSSNFTGSSNTFIGAGAGTAATSMSNAVLIGYQAGYQQAAVSSSVLIGYQAGFSNITGRNVMIGVQAGYSVTGANNVFIGETAGNNAPVATSNTFVAGSNGSGTSARIDNVYFGQGYYAAAPTAYTINGTGGLGTDIAGADVNIAGGIGTGTGAAGKISLKVAPAAGSTSATSNTLVTAGQYDANTTAGETRFLLYDITAGTLKRVSIGAADSGGTGYKVLRIPN